MQEIKELLQITQKLKERYPNKQFSLDGKLVGDIGEVLAAAKYGLELLPENTRMHDAIEIVTGRKIQIKSSFKGNFYFPCGEERLPDYLLFIQISEEGELKEIYNGTGVFLYENYIKKNNLKPYKNSYYTVSKGVLQRINEEVPVIDKVKLSLIKP